MQIFESTQDIFSKMALRQEGAARSDVSLNLTTEVSVYGTLVRSIEACQKACAEGIQRIAIRAGKDKIINVCCDAAALGMP